MPRGDGLLSHDLLPGEKGPQDACGVFGVWAPGEEVAKLTYFGLYALQHRGQESAGIAVSDGAHTVVYKDMGLVSQVFTEASLESLHGHIAIGHARYSTTGSSVWNNSQPVYRGAAAAEFALGHNGNLVNTAELAEELGMLPGTVGSDSDVLAELLARELTGPAPAPGAASHLEQALLTVLPRLRGAFSLVLMDQHRVIGVRDPNGFRPLCLGRLDNGWVLASESPALDVVGAHLVRELEPGEMVVIDETGWRSVRPFGDDAVEPKLCLFEFVYFARPDARLYGQIVHEARVRMGEQLAEQAPAEADLVMGVPESGIPAAEGFARRSGIPYGQGLVKNRYIGRTFIAPTQELRALGVRMKLNPLRDNIAGKRLVVIDDSIVRGNTSKKLIEMLRQAGATEVHMRIVSPEVLWPCFYGIDTDTRDQLIAANMTNDEMCEWMGADSLAFISLQGLRDSLPDVRTPGYCEACFSGEYPVDIPAYTARNSFMTKVDFAAAYEKEAQEAENTQVSV